MQACHFSLVKRGLLREIDAAVCQAGHPFARLPTGQCPCSDVRKGDAISTPRLNKSDRQARIVAELRAAPTLRVNELSARLEVSAETVRRDLAELDERGLISRTYGGAMR